MRSFKILKSDLKRDPWLSVQFSELSEEVQEVGNSIVYSPFPWKLMAFMTLLSKSRVKAVTVPKD